MLTATLYGSVFLITGLAGFFAVELVRLQAAIQLKAPKDLSSLESALRECSCPVVVPNAREFVELTFAAPDALLRRVQYVSSAENAARYKADVDNERIMITVARWSALQVVPLKDFDVDRQTFLLFGRPDRGWILPRLLEKGVPVRPKAIGADNVLLLVNPAKD